MIILIVLIQLYRLLKYNGDVSSMWYLFCNVVIRAMSVANVITRTHLIVRDGSLFVHVWMVVFGLLAVLPHILSRWLTYATILVSDIWLGHKMVNFSQSFTSFKHILWETILNPLYTQFFLPSQVLVCS